MKKTISTITLGLLISLSSFATVRTVNNYIANAAQYSSVQTAINVAAVGDTLLIHGSPISYGNITLNRKLCLIGAGCNLTNTVNNFNTILGYIIVDTINATPKYSVSGFSIHGIYALSLDFLVVSGHPTGNKANNVIISRCQIGNINSKGTNWVIKNNYIGFIETGYVGISSNITIANNYIVGSISNGSSSTSFALNVIATNNIFTYATNSFTYNVLFTNNIFLNYIIHTASSGNIFNKNLTYTGTVTQLNLPPTGNTGSGNINNTNPGFINVPNPTPTTISSAFANYNFAFSTTAAGYNAGTDGTNQQPEEQEGFVTVGSSHTKYRNTANEQQSGIGFTWAILITQRPDNEADYNGDGNSSNIDIRNLVFA
jgi:hypothetical protein